MPRKCDECDQEKFDFRDGGLYCLHCGKHVQGVMAEVDDFDPILTQTSHILSRKKKENTEKNIKAKDYGRPWKTCEGLQLVLQHQIKALINLGASQNVKDAVYYYWVRFLRKTGTAFVTKRGKKLTKEPYRRFRDLKPGTSENAKVHSLGLIRASAIAKRKRKTARRQLNAKAMESSVEILCFNDEQTQQKDLQSTDAANSEATQADNTQTEAAHIPDIQAAATSMSDTQANAVDSTHSMEYETTQETTAQAASHEAFDVALDDYSDMEEDVDIGQGTRKTMLLEASQFLGTDMKRLQERHPHLLSGEVKEQELNKRTLEVARRYFPLNMCMKTTITICYISLIRTGNLVTLADIIKWVNNGKLPYTAVSALFDDNIKFQGGDSQLFNPKAPSSLKWFARHVSRFLLAMNMTLPLLPILSLGQRLIYQLYLPCELQAPYRHLVESTNIPYQVHSDRSRMKFLFNEKCSITYLVVLLKMVFGLDNFKEKKIDWYTGELSKVIKCGKYFDFHIWLRLIEWLELKFPSNILPKDYSAAEHMTNTDEAVTFCSHIFENKRVGVTVNSSRAVESRDAILKQLSRLNKSLPATSDTVDAQGRSTERMHKVNPRLIRCRGETIQHLVQPEKFIHQCIPNGDRVLQGITEEFKDVRDTYIIGEDNLLDCTAIYRRLLDVLCKVTLHEPDDIHTCVRTFERIHIEMDSASAYYRMLRKRGKI